MIKTTIKLSLLISLLWSFDITGQTKNEKLDYFFTLSFGNEDSMKYRLQFFESFPNTFIEYRAIYNNPNSSLHSQSYNHIKLFENLEVVDDTIYMKKLIDLSIGGFWDADAVTMLQYLIGRKIFKNLKLLTYLLKKRTPAEIRSFTYFYFDGITVRFDKFPKQLEVIKEYDKFIYTLMESTYKNVVTDTEYVLKLQLEEFKD